MDNKPNAAPAWPKAIGSLIVICTLLALALVAVGGWPWFKQFFESSAAAWVQAIGSIGALFVAIEIGRRDVANQRKLAYEHQIQEERKRLLVIDALLEAIEKSVAAAKEAHENAPSMPVWEWHWHQKRIKNSADALARIDLFNCPPGVIQPLLHLFPALRCPLNQQHDDPESGVAIVVESFRCSVPPARWRH